MVSVNANRPVQGQNGIKPSVPSHATMCRNRRSRPTLRNTNHLCVKSSAADDVEPDWEEEMSIFKKRTLKPSQLEALRKLEEEKVDVGRVRGMFLLFSLHFRVVFIHFPPPPHWPRLPRFLLLHSHSYTK